VPRVLILIPTMNRNEDLQKALESISIQDYKSRLTIVLNNGDDCYWTVAQFNDTLYLDMKGNRGVCEATNIGASYTRSEYILLMDNDCILLSPDLITQLAQFLDDNPEYAAVCPMHIHNAHNTYTMYSESSVRAFCRNYYGISNPYIEQDVGLFYGTTCLIRSSVWRMLGGFDTRYFAYCQENELSARMVNEGYRIRYLPTAIAYHNLSRTSRSPGVSVLLPCVLQPLPYTGWPIPAARTPPHKV